MEQLFDGINERGRRVRELLSGPSSAFVLVAGPDEQILGESEAFAERMAEMGMPLEGVVMNRLHPCAGDSASIVDTDALAALLASQGVSSELGQWLVQTHRDTTRIAESEAMRRESFEAGLPETVAMVAVPEFEHDVHELADLAEITKFLCG